ncbi:MAG: M56 family metallopeptidase [Saprospiraceae bacterium]|nr:M56 family metallopeptidase [Saprospiraceae bacterium]
MENLFSFFTKEFQYAIGWTVIHSLWQATVIAILSGVVMIAFRKKTAQLRYWIHNFALYSVLFASIVTFGIYFKDAKNGLFFKQTEQTAAAADNTKVTVETLNQLKVSIETGNETAATPANSSPLSIEGMKAYFDEHIYFVVLIWLLGVGLFILKLLGGVSYVYYLRLQHNFPVDEYWLDMVETLSKKVNINKSIELVESALVRSPIVVGYLKPMILFPIGAINRLNPQEVEAILAHEIAHVMRHDYVFNILQSVIEAMYYFNPAVWWISANIRAERENCCDDVAIQLCGNSMTYAKSLVVVQEMQYYSATFAMGFAGQRKNQLLLRVQRVLNQSNNKSNVMEKLIATCLIVIGIVFLSFGGQNNFIPSFLEDNTFFITEDAPLSTAGYWNATIKGENVTVSFQNKTENGTWNTTHTFKKSEFSALPTTESDFSITREAGVMNFKGKFEDNEGYGKFTFTESADFRAFLEKEGITGAKESTMMHYFMGNINREYVSFLKQNGFEKISKSKLEELAIHGLTKNELTSYLDAFKKYGNELTLNKLIELKIHGIDAKYQKSLSDLGYIDIPLNEIVEAKIHGINADYLADLQSSGYKPEALREVIEFKIHGVDGAFIKKMKAATNKELSAEELVESKIHGLDKLDVEKFKSTGTNPTADDLQSYAIHGVNADYVNLLTGLFGKLSPERIVEAKIHGIDNTFIESYKAMGFQNLNIQKAIEFKIHGVDAAFVKSLNDAGYKDMSANKVVELKIHGVDAAYVKKFEELGYKNMPINKLVEFKIHGVDANYVKNFENIGLKDLPANRLVEMRIHGVTADYVKGFQDLGFKNLDLQDIINAKIHGLTPQYVQEMRNKGFKDLDFDEYIELKLRGYRQ